MQKLILAQEAMRHWLLHTQEFGLSKRAQERLRWFLFMVEHNFSISETCEHFGIRERTLNQWLNKFDAIDPQSIEDASHRPHSTRTPETSPEAIALIEKYRKLYPSIGKTTLAALLKQEHGIALSSATVGREIQRNKFFFADTPSHRRKRGVLANESDALEETQPTSLVPAFEPAES